MIKEKFKPLLSIVFTAINSMLLFMSSGAVLMSPMIFDAPGSTEQFFPWMFLSFILMFPVLTIVSLIVSIRQYIKKNFSKSFMFSILPSIYITLGIGLLLIVENFIS